MKRQSSSPTLSELQKEMAQIVTSLPRMTAADHASGAWITSQVDNRGQGLTSDERIAIYADGWYMRIEESLAEDYPKLRALCGDKQWHELIEMYVKQHPSSSYTLSRTGDDLPFFLSRQKSVETWQVDLSELEKSLYKIGNAEDVKVWNVAELESMNPDDAENLAFEFQAGVELLESDWNIEDLFGGDSQEPKKQKTYMFVYKDLFTPEFRAVEPEEFKFLNRLKDGATLGQITEEFPDQGWVQWLVAAASIGSLRPKKLEAK